MKETIVYCRQLKSKIEKGMENVFKQYNLSVCQGFYLLLFNNYVTLTLNEITTLMEVDKSNTTRVINSLLDKKLLSKSDDIRKYKLSLTSDGKKIVSNLSKEIEKRKQEILNGITEQDLKCFEKVLNKITKNLEG